MGRAFARDCPEADAIVERAVAAIGREIGEMRIPHLDGVVLGGGYGRGEGGVFEGVAGEPPRLSNDLDFYVVADGGATRADERAISAALAPVGAKWTDELGVDVDFCAPKTPDRLRRDSRRMMLQELVRGYVDVAGRPGTELFAPVRVRPLSELPWIEAVRLLVNRGAGLLFMAGRPDDYAFAARNIDKCVLGAHDARLMARGDYVWGADARAALLRDRLYDRALKWKYRPGPAAVCAVSEARAVWLSAADEIARSPRRGAEARRGARHALRWLARRRSLGPAPTFGLDPLLRILREMEPLVRAGAPFTPALRRDWDVFN